MECIFAYTRGFSTYQRNNIKTLEVRQKILRHAHFNFTLDFCSVIKHSVLCMFDTLLHIPKLPIQHSVFGLQVRMEYHSLAFHTGT